ncbi:MAG: peroxiredoxin-like family protein [Rhodospirillaceae bacterium]
MKLTREIAEFEAEKQRSHARDVLDMIDLTTADLVATGIAEKALKVGDAAPDFTLPDALDNPVGLGGLLADGPLIVNFYRGSWCPYCNLELRAYQRELARIREKGAALVAISPMVPDESLSVQEKNALAFPVLSDVGCAVADAFGLVFTVDPRIQEMYLTRLGNDLPTLNGDDTFRLPMAATYVIGADGRIKYAYVEADYRTRADPEDVIAALD